MKDIPDGSVDLVLIDPPYGTTACKWDSIIPLEPMWEQLKRIIKPNGAIVMTASQPFTTMLIASNLKMFKYELIWVKSQGVNFMSAKYQPLKTHENILVFYDKQSVYNPLLLPKSIETLKRQKRARNIKKINSEHNIVDFRRGDCDFTRNGYPPSVFYFKNERNNQYKKSVFHPTQKPVAIMEYLIKTYTNEGETVLDFAIGSGTTAVACINTNRKFIGIELDPKYVDIANKRIQEALSQTKLQEGGNSSQP
jgi:site-specific DNA-methyltransferase (adenine-specific)